MRWTPDAVGSGSNPASGSWVAPVTMRFGSYGRMFAIQRDDHRPLGGVCLPKRKMDDLSPMRGDRQRHREGDEKFVYPRAGGDNDHIDRDMAAVKHDAGDSVVVYGKCRVAGDNRRPMMASGLDKRKAERIAVDTRGVSHMNRPLDRTEWRKHCAGPFRGFPGQCAKVGHAIFPTLNEHRHDRFKPPVFSVAERDHQLPRFAVQRIGRADLGKRCEEGRKVAHCVLREVDRRGGKGCPQCRAQQSRRQRESRHPGPYGRSGRSRTRCAQDDWQRSPRRFRHL